MAARKLRREHPPAQSEVRSTITADLDQKEEDNPMTDTTVDFSHAEEETAPVESAAPEIAEPAKPGLDDLPDNAKTLIKGLIEAAEAEVDKFTTAQAKLEATSEEAVNKLAEELIETSDDESVVELRNSAHEINQEIERLRNLLVDRNREAREKVIQLNGLNSELSEEDRQAVIKAAEAAKATYSGLITGGESLLLPIKGFEGRFSEFVKPFPVKVKGKSGTATGTKRPRLGLVQVNGKDAVIKDDDGKPKSSLTIAAALISKQIHRGSIKATDLHEAMYRAIKGKDINEANAEFDFDYTDKDGQVFHLHVIKDYVFPEGYTL